MSRVAAGAVLARIADRTIRAQFLGARSGVTTAQTAADIAARELSRNEKLAEAGAIAERDLEAARRNNVAAQSQLDDAKARLEVMVRTNDGFALAEKDLEIRGPGEGFGTRQAGGDLFKVADLSKDLDLLKMARQDAAEWIAKSPSLSKPEETLVRRRLVKAHGQWIGLGDVG